MNYSWFSQHLLIWNIKDSKILLYRPWMWTLTLMFTVDIMTHVAWRQSNLLPTQVIGVGCNLDSERLSHIINISLVANNTGKQAWVIGELSENKGEWIRSCLTYFKVFMKSFSDLYIMFRWAYEVRKVSFALKKLKYFSKKIIFQTFNFKGRFFFKKHK